MITWCDSIPSHKGVERNGAGTATLLLAILAAMVWAALPATARAARSIDWIRATPDAFPVGAPATVQVTAQVGVDAALLPDSVTLLRYDAAEHLVGRLGRMYDDGTHGDALQGDGIFTAQTVLDATQPQAIKLRASVAYRGQMRRVMSDFFTVMAQSTVTPEETLALIVDRLQANDTAGALSHFGGSDADRQALEGLNDRARAQLATAFANAQLVEDAGDLRQYSAPWVVQGQPLQLEFTMKRTDTGDWLVISW